MKTQVNGIEVDYNCSKYLDSRGSRVSRDWAKNVYFNTAFFFECFTNV